MSPAMDMYPLSSALGPMLMRNVAFWSRTSISMAEKGGQSGHTRGVEQELTGERPRWIGSSVPMGEGVRFIF